MSKRTCNRHRSLTRFVAVRYQPLRLTASRPVAAALPEATAAEISTSSPEAQFADEEDFQKAGGSDLRYVQMQAFKSMEEQPKIASKLPALDASEIAVLDVLVVGCGPAGLALAAESAKRGLAVGLVGRDLPFVNNYGVWVDEFQAIGLGHCIDQVWSDTILYTDSDTPISTKRPYGRVDRLMLYSELLKRCQESGVRFLEREVDAVGDDVSKSTVVCTDGTRLSSRLVVVAAGAASGRFLQYDDDTRGVGVQTAYGVEVELASPYPYSPSAMVFMDYRDLQRGSKDVEEEEGEFAQLPTFLYAMPSSNTRVFFEETCLAARPAMPFSILKQRLQRRLATLGVRYTVMHEEEWSYIPVGGSLPLTNQQRLGFGAAAAMVHPATGYSITRSLTEAPKYAAALAEALRANRTSAEAAAQAWSYLWSADRRRQRAFMIFGLELILQLDVPQTRDFFNAFFKLPDRLWRGFLASELSSLDLLLFAFTTFTVASNALRFQLITHLVTDPSGANLIRTYMGVKNPPAAKNLPTAE